MGRGRGFSIQYFTVYKTQCKSHPLLHLLIRMFYLPHREMYCSRTALGGDWFLNLRMVLLHLFKGPVSYLRQQYHSVLQTQAVLSLPFQTMYRFLKKNCYNLYNLINNRLLKFLVVREKGQLLFVCLHSPSLFLDLDSQFQMKNFPWFLLITKKQLFFNMKDTTNLKNVL